MCKVFCQATPMDCFTPYDIGVVTPEDAHEANSQVVKVFYQFFVHSFIGYQLSVVTFIGITNHPLINQDFFLTLKLKCRDYLQTLVGRVISIFRSCLYSKRVCCDLTIVNWWG